MDKINISIRLDELDQETKKRLESEVKKRNRSKFIKECIEKSVHNEHIINKISSLENEILEIKNILLSGSFSNNVKFKNDEKNNIKEKSVHDEHNLKSLEQDLLNALKY